MNRKTITILLIIAIILQLASCQKTPEDAHVKSKTEDTFMDVIQSTTSVDKTKPVETNNSNKFIDLIDLWESSVEVNNKPITVNINAKIITPDTDKTPVHYLEFIKVKQEQVDSFLAKYGEIEYYLNINDLYTKDYYENEILELKKYIEVEIPNKPKEEQEYLIENAQISISNMMQTMEDAPTNIDDVILPLFTNKYIILRDSQIEYYEDEINANNMDEESQIGAKEQYEKTETEAINVKWENIGLSFVLDVTRSIDYNNLFRFAVEDNEKSGAFLEGVISNNIDLEGLKISFIEAKEIANQAVDRLQIDYMELADTAKLIEFKDASREYYDNKSYIFFYTRALEGIGINYCSNSIEYINQYNQPWPYETLVIYVNDNGIKNVEWSGGATYLGECITEDAILKPLSEIQSIAESQFSIGNIDFANTGINESNYDLIKSMYININEIVFGYMKTKLSDNSGKYVLVPVWDFYGNYEAEFNRDFRSKVNSLQTQSLSSYRHSYLTINAIDGSIIDRSLGY